MFCIIKKSYLELLLSFGMNLDQISLSPDVEEALALNRPILAMESTIITHGLPYPENYNFLQKANRLVRSFGVVPATVAVVSGSICVGLNKKQEKAIFQQEGLIKISLRDLGFSLSSGSSGGTTVSATTYIAHMAGISVFATGGIGGVHRGAAYSFDVSQDLLALSKYPVTTISAGAKAVLDIGKTRELLETLSVPIVGYKTGAFPVFYSRGGGGGLSWRAETVEELARFVNDHFKIKAGSGVLIANPPPKEVEMSIDRVERLVESAIEKSVTRGIVGKKLTPFLLEEINKETGGKSVETNVALALNNIQLGARLAVALNKN